MLSAVLERERERKLYPTFYRDKNKPSASREMLRGDTC